MEAVIKSMNKTALDEACEDARHYHDMWQAAARREERLRVKVDRLRRDWEALERVLGACEEWPRGAVLASDGRLLEWVLRNDPAETKSDPPAD